MDYAGTCLMIESSLSTVSATPKLTILPGPRARSRRSQRFPRIPLCILMGSELVAFLMLSIPDSRSPPAANLPSKARNWHCMRTGEDPMNMQY